MSEWIVACPECATQFRVTEAHRCAADGLVRCGACLTVFRAEEARLFPEGGEEAENAAGSDRDSIHARRHRSVLASSGTRERASAERPVDMGEEDPVAVDEAYEEMRDAEPAPPRLEEIRLPAEAERVEAALDAQRIALERRRRARPWLALGVVALLGLCVQWVWIRFDALALAPETRGMAVAWCDAVGCDLPVRRDVDAIRSQSLSVRSHPERVDGLRVDAVIVNRAPWPQAFPHLELRFSDIDGRPVAMRRFAPSEYLAGELAGMREMPVSAPVQISLELVDPGPSAVNYEMRLH